LLFVCFAWLCCLLCCVAVVCLVAFVCIVLFVLCLLKDFQFQSKRFWSRIFLKNDKIRAHKTWWRAFTGGGGCGRF
jgi:type III secretory pathway component EscU